MSIYVQERQEALRDVKLNWVDRACMAFFPTMGKKRLLARYEMKQIEGAGRVMTDIMSAWEGAVKDRFHGSNWLGSKLSPDSYIEQDIAGLIEHAEELARNDPFASAYVHGFAQNVIGCGLQYQSRMVPVEGYLEEAEAEKFNKELEWLFWRWCPFASPYGNISFYRLQKLMARRFAVTGNAITVTSDVGRADKPVPLSLEVVAIQRLLETPPSYAGDNNFRFGIQRNNRGEIVKYHIRRKHPNDSKEVNFDWKAYEPERVHHWFEPMYEEQSLGVPPLAPVMSRLKDLKDLNEAELIGRQVAACYSVFIKGSTNPLTRATAHSTSTTSDGQRLEELNPGRVHYLGPDEDIAVASPSYPGTELNTFIEGHLRAIAAGSNFVYELLAKDYSKTTYSSGRLSLIDGRIGFKSAQNGLTETTLNPLAKRFVQECIDFSGETSIDPERYAETPWVYEVPSWIAPAWPWIDPQKEIQASILAIQANLDCHSDVLASQGKDFEEVVQKLAKEKALMEKLGLTSATIIPEEPKEEVEEKPPSKKKERAYA